MSDRRLPPMVTYAERCQFVRDGMARVHEAAKPATAVLLEREQAMQVLTGGSPESDVRVRLALPGNATLVLVCQSRYQHAPTLDVRLVHPHGGTVPEPDPVLTVAGALYTPELVEEARLAFDAAVAWCRDALE